MRFILFTLFFLVFSVPQKAQSSGCTPIPELSTSFEGCPSGGSSNDIYDGCAPGWFPSTGSPNGVSSIGSTVAFDGDHMIVLGVSNSNGNCLAESMFLDVSSLVPGTEYELCVWVNVPLFGPVERDLDFAIDYTSGVPVNNNPDNLGPCVPVSSNPLFSASNFTTDGWQNIVVSFEAVAGLNQIHFVPSPSGLDSRILIDNFEIKECDPCEGVNVDAEFRFDPDPITSNYTILRPDLYDTYDDINGEHSWTILRSSSPNGPYSYVTTYTGDDFVFLATNGVYYTVLHRVVTDCGTACYGWNTCQGCGLGLVQTSCDLCGPIDCDLIDNPCSIITPDRLRCSENWRGDQILTWSNVPNTVLYVIQILPGGDCCTDGLPVPSPFFMYTTESQIPPPLQAGNCFSWRVLAYCENGGYSDWSDLQCTDLKRCGIFDDQVPGSVAQGRSMTTDLNSNDLVQNELMAFPNPASSGMLELAFGPLEKNEAQLMVYSIDGRQVINQRLDANVLKTGRYQLNYSNFGLEAGTYVARISSDNLLLSTRFIIAR